MLQRLLLVCATVCAICAMAATGKAQCVTSLPFNFINGTVADATQVMANFNAALQCAQAAAATVPNQSTLAAQLTASYPKGVVRNGYTLAGDAPPVLYLAETGTCASQIPARINDSGSCINTSSGDGNSFFAVFPASGADIREWGAKCDGSTTDDAAVIAAGASGIKHLVAPAGATCLFGGMTITGPTVFDMNGATVKLTTGHSSAITVTGNAPKLMHFAMTDPSNFSLVSTTLSGAATAGSTTVTVTSATGLAAHMPIAINLTSGIYHTTTITNVVGTTIALADPIPGSATSVALVAGGSGACTTADPLTFQGGTGHPATVTATGNGSAVTAIALADPGRYTTTPGAGAALTDYVHRTCIGATGTLTLAGASNGATVLSAHGMLRVTNANNAFIEDGQIDTVPLGVEVSETTSNSTFDNTIKDFVITNIGFGGYWRDATVHDNVTENIIVWGIRASPAPFAWYLNGANGFGGPAGGNIYRNIRGLQVQQGILVTNDQLDFFETMGMDTSYEACNFYGVDNENFSGITYCNFTGPLVTTGGGTGGQGVGLYIGPWMPTPLASQNNIFDRITTGGPSGIYNATDLYIDTTLVSGAGTTVWLTGVDPGESLGGNTLGIQNQETLISFNTGGASVGGAWAVPIYVGNSGPQSATESDVLVQNPKTGSTTGFVCGSRNAPGSGNTYTCTLRVVSGGVATNVGTCSWTGGSSFGCVNSGPGYPILGGFANSDSIDIQINGSGASPPANFFRGYLSAK